MKTVVDLFAGCGGMSLGLEDAGFTPIFVSELHTDARATYLRNRPGLPVAQTMNQAGDILELTQQPAQLEALANRLRSEYADVDLVVGGPPCQGFSGIGHRRTFKDLQRFDIPSNHLYKEMATFVAAIGPRAFVFENVKGLLSARWSGEGQKGEIWQAVREAFGRVRTTAGKRYAIQPDLLVASDYGVPQNRPRVILIGVREDVNLSEVVFHPKESQGWVDPMDLLDDLVDADWYPGGRTTTYPKPATTAIQEALRTPRGADRPAEVGDRVTEQEYSKHSATVRARFRAIRENGQVPEEMRTKKFNQRLIPARWDDRGPNITVASLPDDYVHYGQDRACTVREWARLQTFPDWYQFSGKRTTGGRHRAGDPGAGVWTRELPKFTQIGNAVPVRMAEAIGRHLTEIGICFQDA